MPWPNPTPKRALRSSGQKDRNNRRMTRYNERKAAALHNQVALDTSESVSPDEREVTAEGDLSDNHEMSSTDGAAAINVTSHVGVDGDEVERWSDLTSHVVWSVSSRQAMLPSLTDGSTETFWESGDEDRNKTKWIALIIGKDQQARSVAVHIDNGRDIANKVGSLTFKTGKTIDDMVVVKTVEVENRFAGWVTCFLSEGNCDHVRVELKGPDNTVRLRQVRVIGKLQDVATPSPAVITAPIDNKDEVRKKSEILLDSLRRGRKLCFICTEGINDMGGITAQSIDCNHKEKAHFKCMTTWFEVRFHFVIFYFKGILILHVYCYRIK